MKPGFDKHFKNKLFDLEEDVPIHVWDNLQNHLRQQKIKKQRTIFYRIAASIALLLSFASGYYLATSKSEIKSSTEYTFQQDKPESVKHSGKIIIQNNLSSEKPMAGTFVPKAALVEQLKIKKDNNEVLIDNNIERENFLVQKMSILGIQKLQCKSNLIPELVYNGHKLESPLTMHADEKQNKDLKWIMAGAFAPGQIYNSGKSNENSGQFAFSEKNNFNTVYSGQVQFGLYLSPRVMVCSGLAYAQINQSNQLAVTAATNVFYQNSPLGRVEKQLTAMLVDVEDIQGSSGMEHNTVFGQFDQKLEYLEFPVIAKYKVIDRKLDINLNAGFMAGYLIENSSGFSYKEEYTNLGPTEGIHRSSLTSVAGFSAEYPVFGNLSLSIEPSIKYHLMQVGQNSAYKPIIFNIFTGLNYTF